MIPSRIIEQYQSYCTQNGFDPAGQRSLYRMIDVCAASLQTSLQGLDNTTAEGTDAVDNMNDLVDTLGNLGSSDHFTKPSTPGNKEGRKVPQDRVHRSCGSRENVWRSLYNLCTE